MKTMTLVGSNLRGRAGSPLALTAAIALLSMLPLGIGSATVDAAPLKTGGRAMAPRTAPPPSQLIVRFRDEQSRGERIAMTVPRVDGLSKSGGSHLLYRRPMIDLAHVFRFAEPVTQADAEAVAARLRRDPAVAEVEIDDYLFPLFEPNDGFYTNTTVERMWHLKAPTALHAGGVNLPAAWDITRGAGVVVAVIDTGIFNQEDLEPNILRGYDFTSADSATNGGGFLVANDGDGRDADPSDPGDWISAEDKAQPIFATCRVGNSSWHGTHVSGTVAAVGDNGIGAVGVAFASKVLAVRALGKCFGYGADITDAIWWAAGGIQPATSQALGLPPNPNPAKVINLSLGSSNGSCSTSRQNAINAARSAGAVVVVATGNDGQVGISSPANCQGVIAVTAHTVEGDNASYANVGPGTAISAPGGGSCTVAALNCLPQGSEGAAGTLYRFVFSTTGDGAQGPGTGRNLFVGKAGTSMAAPHVSGVAALLFARMPTLKPDTVKTLLTASARPFPVGTYCAGAGAADGRCGTGMLDAKRALDRLDDLTPVVTAAPPAAIVRNGAAVTLTATATPKAGGLQALTYRWQQLSGPAVTLANDTGLQATFTAPSPGGALSFRFTASDADGFAASSAASLRSNALPTVAPPTPVTVTTAGAVSFRVTGSDVDGDTVSFSATGLPTGATFNGATGDFSWLSASPAGIYTVTLTPSDGFESGASASVVITVNDPPRGGGSMDLLGLGLLGLWGLSRLRRRRPRVFCVQSAKHN